MKKSLVLAAALAAISFSSAASALNTNVIRAIRSSNLPLQNLLGVVSFTALGSQGRFCDYLMDWQSPFNPNAATLCVLRELKSPVYPACVVNSLVDITSFVSAGPGAPQGPTYCDGFDTLGIAYQNVTILAGEFMAPPVLQGTAIFPTAVPLIHAIEVA
jgi:hypothetical protein